MTLRLIDLNLLRVFEALMRYRNASAAAEELGVTPSAISHALSRLRKALKDELFIAGGAGMEPTPFAIEIAPEIQGGMDRIFEALQPKQFAPSEMDRTFYIGASDYPATVILPPLISSLSSKAPFVNIRLFPAGRLDVIRSLDEGHVDFFLSWFKEIPERLKRATVLMEEEALVVRNDHPLTQGQLSTARLLEYPFVVVELTGSEDNGSGGYIDERHVVRRNWIERLLIETSDNSDSRVDRAAVTVPYYSAVAPILRRTNMIATLPRSLAALIAQQESIVLLDLPYEPLKVAVEAIWHQRSDRDPGLQWLIKEAIEVMKTTSEQSDGRP